MELSKSSELDRSPMHLLHRASQSVEDLFSRAANSGLTPRQLALLVTVASQPGCNQIEIVARTGIDRSTTAEMMKRMIKKGYVVRKRSERDTRSYVVHLTDKGRRALKNAEPVAKRVDEKVLRALGSRSAVFLENLEALARQLQQAQQA
jgi:DNA-binding MarR family transcriptional regulator